MAAAPDAAAAEAGTAHEQGWRPTAKGAGTTRTATHAAATNLSKCTRSSEALMETAAEIRIQPPPHPSRSAREAAE